MKGGISFEGGVAARATSVNVAAAEFRVFTAFWKISMNQGSIGLLPHVSKLLLLTTFVDVKKAMYICADIL